MLLLPPDLREWLAEGHLAYFVSDVVEQLGAKPGSKLGEIMDDYEQGDGRGRPPYHPYMMVKLLVYAYCIGKVSSRKIEQATYEDVAFRVLTCNQQPDHDSIADFRRRHLAQLAGLFVEVLEICEQAGLVKLGHVAIDGTKLKANASKRRSLSYERMSESEQRLEAEVQRLLAEAQRIDEEEDARYGKGKRGDELPAELQRHEGRLAKIREAMAALEQEARERAAAEARALEQQRQERARTAQEAGRKFQARRRERPDPQAALPHPKAKRNFTDPDSRLVKDGTTQSFLQGYNAQVAVDSEAQIIVAADIVQSNDQEQLVPVLQQVQKNLGRLPEIATADGGYFSSAAVTHEALSGVDLYVQPNRLEPPDLPPGVGPPTTAREPERMWYKLKTERGREIFNRRKAIVEPVFGQIKEVRKYRQVSLRGLQKVRAEWSLVCLTHNLLKLFRATKQLQLA